uniref:Coagulation factor XIII B chain n=1 Tax=Gopherus evgoodei TaxID=1825980 RepID=A0A8C4W3W0_9SAUR
MVGIQKAFGCPLRRGAQSPLHFSRCQQSKGSELPAAAGSPEPFKFQPRPGIKGLWAACRDSQPRLKFKGLRYYYSFKSYYFPMSKEKKLSYTCTAGYTTESGSQDARITCTATGWLPAPKCYKKCSKPLLENGIFSDIKVSYKIWEQLLYRCASGYQTPGGNADETVQCLPEGWSSHPSCAKKFDLHHGHYSTTQRILKLNETLMYECDEGYHTRGGNTIEKAVCRTYGWSLTPNCLVNIKEKIPCDQPPPIEKGTAVTEDKMYYTGDTIRYRCDLGYSINGSNEITCKMGKWTSPPKCIEPCTLNMDDMSNNNIEMKWRLEGELFFLHGDTIDFVCKQGYYLSSSSRQSQLKVQCTRGKLRYPTCIMKGKTGICFCNPIITHQVQTH